MISKVKVSKHALNYFRRLARNTDLEIQAYLIGQVVSPELTVIDYFAYPKKYYEQTTAGVRWFAEEFEAVKKKAEERGKTIVGDLHSHPNWVPIMSPTDYKSQIKEQYRLTGICSTSNHKTKVYFWIIDSSLPCKIIYA